MRIFKKTWGYEEVWAETSRYISKFLYIDPHSRLDRQYHNTKIKSLCVIEGKLTLTTDDSDGTRIVRFLTKGETFHINQKLIHVLSTSDEGAMVVEVSTPEQDDAVILETDHDQ
jgi:quercetin dioxygenase-like cupin family protein